MKLKARIRVKGCPFCDGEINITHGVIGASVWFFKCKKCGAIISFNNDECNTEPSRAKEYFERRVTK